jgi:putative membrane protein
VLMTTESTTTAHTQAPKISADRLAVDRTRLAHERTMMAWIRTSASMISFGFGIYKFFDYFPSDRPIHQGFITPRRFAILLIALGLFVLMGAVAQHWSDLRVLRKTEERIPISLAGLVAALMSILGILALVTAILRD